MTTADKPACSILAGSNSYSQLGTTEHSALPIAFEFAPVFLFGLGSYVDIA